METTTLVTSPQKKEEEDKCNRSSRITRMAACVFFILVFGYLSMSMFYDILKTKESTFAGPFGFFFCLTAILIWVLSVQVDDMKTYCS